MRILVAAVLCAGLSACVSSPPPPPPAPDMTGIDYEHDAHCKSLLMQPGSLVYVQCRLAMSEALRRSEDRRRQIVATQFGPPPQPVERALRDDAFCNLNESSKVSVEFAPAEPSALTAASRCRSTRARFERELRAWQPFAVEELLLAYDRGAVATNLATIEEARAFR